MENKISQKNQTYQIGSKTRKNQQRQRGNNSGNYKKKNNKYYSIYASISIKNKSLQLRIKHYSSIYLRPDFQ